MNENPCAFAALTKDPEQEAAILKTHIYATKIIAELRERIKVLEEHSHDCDYCRG